MGTKPGHAPNVYADPMCAEVCPIINLGIYMLCFPFTDYQQVFPGRDQYYRCSKLIRYIVLVSVKPMSPQRNHSRKHWLSFIRKVVATFVFCGSTACPPNLRSIYALMSKIGGVADTYLRYKSAGGGFPSEKLT